jgi:hypothetical protein
MANAHRPACLSGHIIANSKLHRELSHLFEYVWRSFADAVWLMVDGCAG